MISFNKLALVLGLFAGTACGGAPEEGDSEPGQSAAPLVLSAESRADSDFTALLKYVPPADRLDFEAELDDGVAHINKCGQAACLCTGRFCADLIDAGYCEDFHCALEQPGDYAARTKPSAQSEPAQCICIF
jgi:hypothetical protein